MSQLSKNIDFGQNFRKIAILLKISNNLNFGQICQQIAILVEISEKLDLSKNFRKFLFWSIFTKI